MFSRSFVRKRLISLATTTLFAATSLACTRGPTSSHHLPRAMPIRHAADRPDEASRFLSEQDVAIDSMMGGMTVKLAGNVGLEFSSDWNNAGPLQPPASFMTRSAGSSIANAVGAPPWLVHDEDSIQRRHLVIAESHADRPGPINKPSRPGHPGQPARS